jgi:type IV pilus assembly protein PilY1
MFAAVPPFITAGAPPLLMLVMGRDHKLYYEAYNDASDLDGDGDLDVGFTPSITYYGYFDTEKCYTYNSTSGLFEPSSTTVDGKCSGASEWSGNWMNYTTMSRMDALRKVLYGGYRSTDSTTETILERAYIPRDAHTWGKEYESEVRDGYDIRDYTPLDLPPDGTRHMFASTSLTDAGDSGYNPLMRVLPNNPHRIWEWVSKEQPVADDSLVITSGNRYEGFPADHAEYDTLVADFANAAHLQGFGAPANGRIDGSGNPWGSDDYYLTLFTGFINITTAGDYQFAVDGDDAVEVIIDGTVVAGWYGGHGTCGCTTYNGTITLSAGNHVIEFRQQEKTGGDSYYLGWNGPDSGNVWEIVPASAFDSLIMSTYDVQYSSSSTITDYVVKVKVCDPTMPEENCQLYPDGVYKPIGILQRHGETNAMYFGLISGSFAKNTKGGVLRKPISSIKDEINENTGQLTSVNGIIKTIDKIRINQFNYSGFSYSNCGWIATKPITDYSDGTCGEWGNPIGEMIYEGMRYFSGASSPTSDFTYSSGPDVTLGLPLATWDDPFDASTGYSRCAKPFLLVISDINPSFDSDQLPGSYFNAFGGTLGTLNVETTTNTIGTNESISGQFYIGQYQNEFDTSCAPKSVTSFGDVRGLCPEEPTKQGSYYSAAVSYYGHINDINTFTEGDQKVTSYMVGLSSPLPRIEIPINGQTITLVPFAKSVGGYGISSTRGNFQPTNTIVDFYVQTITPVYGMFRINYEDVEQGADHDMDAIIIYEYQLVDASGNPVTAANINDAVAVDITLTSEYAAGSIIQHCGYIISGTTADGTYLDVRDIDTTASSDPDYFLDTPPGIGPNQGPSDNNWDDNVALPLTNTRRFSPASGVSAAQLMENPLYYAAKWGAFRDSNENDIPDLASEWDEDGDGLPDTYFYVVNPLMLEEKLNQSFASMLERTSSGTAASVISGSRTGEGAAYSALFFPNITDIYGNELTWAGRLHSLFVDHFGNLREDSNGNATLDMINDQIVSLYFDINKGQTMVRYMYDSDGDGVADGTASIGTLSDLKPIWDGSKWLAQANPVASRSYADVSKNRRIWTWIDKNNDGLVSDDGIVDGTETSTSETILFDPGALGNRQAIAPYLMARAILATNMGGSNNDIEFSAVNPGIVGEAVTIEFVNPGASYPSTTVSVTGTAITVNLSTNSSGVITATAAHVVSAVNADAASSTLVNANLAEGDSGGGLVTTLSATNLSLDDGTKKLMEYVVGQDQDYWRKRQIEVETGVVRTWKMADIIYSTPTVIGQPSEDYDLIYDDTSYFNFRQAFAKRRQVVYLGSNGGTLHAFNGGFWDRKDRKFYQTMATRPVTYDPISEEYIIDYGGSMVTPPSYDLGAEIWSFVPQAVLPHLQWLHERDYPHVYTVDLKPKVTDIKFADGSWRTILICGLRLGGQEITTSDDFDYDGTVTTPAETRTFTSEVFALDVTDPESPPKLLWSFTHPNLGLTTSYPTVARVDDQWFVLVGSGPIGPLATRGQSDQHARLFVLNAETGTMARINPFDLVPSELPKKSTLREEAISFMADPVTVDYDLYANQVSSTDFRWSHEFSYIGSSSGTPGAWSGRMYRIKLTDDAGMPETDPNLWELGILLDVDGPISAPANITRDLSGALWVYFGVGRFWTVDDKTECAAACTNPTSGDCVACIENSKRWFYGVMEPRDKFGTGFNYSEASMSNIVDVSNFKVYETGFVDTDGDGIEDQGFSDLVASVRNGEGWRIQFDEEGERSLFQPVVLGGLVTFTTYVPSTDVCEYEGTSNLYALYYQTGTAWKESVIGTGSGSINVGGSTYQRVLSKVSLGSGLATAPSMHLGADSKVMVQSSTGAIISITQEAAIKVKSGLKAWKEDF